MNKFVLCKLGIPCEIERSTLVAQGLAYFNQIFEKQKKTSEDKKKTWHNDTQ